MFKRIEKNVSWEKLKAGLSHEEIDGYKIAYVRGGSGEPMLLIHGITTYSFIWKNLIPFLSGDYDVIAVDMLGCGASDKPAGVDYSIEAQARIMVRLLQKLGIEKVHLVTHDIGGGVGQIMAVEFPRLLRDLILINTVAYDFWPVQPIITMRIPFLRQLAMAIMDFGVLRAIVRRGMYHKERVSDELMKLFEEPLKTREGRQGFLQLAKCIDNTLLTERAEALRNVDLPVLIIRGDADPYLSRGIAEKLHREIGGSRLEIVATGGHFIQEDEPELLVQMIGNFIQNIR